MSMLILIFVITYTDRVVLIQSMVVLIQSLVLIDNTPPGNTALSVLLGIY